MKCHRSFILFLLAVGGLPNNALGEDPLEAIPLTERAPLDFTSLKERPLFSPQRAAPALNMLPVPDPEPIVTAPAAVTESDMSSPDWQLVGLVRSQRVNRAILKDPRETTSFVLGAGEERQGWKLTEIGRFEIVLERGDRRIEIGFPKEPDAAGASFTDQVAPGAPAGLQGAQEGTTIGTPRKETFGERPDILQIPMREQGSGLAESFSPAQQQ